MAQSTFAIKGNAETALAALFTQTDDGRLVICGSGRSIVPSTVNSVSEEFIEFQDYLMEGFVRYELRVQKEPERIVLVIRKSGTNRDQYIDSHLKWLVKQAGFAVSESAI